MSQNDYIQRQIEGLARFIAKTVFHKEMPSEELIEEDGTVDDSGLLHHLLTRMADDGQINEAENLLFEKLEANPSPSHFAVAMRFYQELSIREEQWLRDNGFSHEEIAEGLDDVKALAEKQ